MTLAIRHPRDATRRHAQTGSHQHGIRQVPGLARIAWSAAMTTSLSELHLRCDFGCGAVIAEIEEGLRMETERAGDQHCREVLDAGVIFLHGVIVEAPRGCE